MKKNFFMFKERRTAGQDIYDRHLQVWSLQMKDALIEGQEGTLVTFKFKASYGWLRNSKLKDKIRRRKITKRLTKTNSEKEQIENNAIDFVNEVRELVTEKCSTIQSTN